MERSSLPLLYGKTERLAERRTEVSKKVSDILPKTEIGIGITKRRFNTNNLGAGSGLLFEDMTAKRKQKPGTICG